MGVGFFGTGWWWHGDVFVDIAGGVSVLALVGGEREALLVFGHRMHCQSAGLVTMTCMMVVIFL